MPVRKKTTAKRKPAQRTTAKRKTTIKKTTTKKTVKRTTKKPVKRVTKKISSKKSVTSAPKKVKLGTLNKGLTKSQVMGHISESTGVTKKDVSAVFECLSDVIQSHVKKGAIGTFTLPGLAKFRVVRKPATKARKGINPFTGEPTTFKAKPARNIIKIRPLKKVKDMAS